MILFSFLLGRGRLGSLPTLLDIKGELMQEKIWKFRVNDGEIDCASYFRKRASELASALNYQLIATSEVEVGVGVSVRTVSGVALVDGQHATDRKGGRDPNCVAKARDQWNLFVPPTLGASGSLMYLLKIYQFKQGVVSMNAIIYLVGIVVVVLFILSFFGLR
jgi:hypothetical protein